MSIFEQGDIISINFDPSLNHEPAGWHPAVVLSPWRVNAMSSLTAVIPVTSKDNGYPFHVKIADGNPIHGFIQCETVRAIDLTKRERENRLKVHGALDDETLGDMLATVKVVLGLDG